MKDLITIGLPSKGRLKEKAVTFFNNKGLKVLQGNKERNYFAKIEGKTNLKIIYLHAKEIIQRLGDGTLDIGISGLDLLNESEKNLQDKISVNQKLDFGNADLVVAVPNDWIDVQTIADLEEVSEEMRKSLSKNEIRKKASDYLLNYCGSLNQNEKLLLIYDETTENLIPLLENAAARVTTFIEKTKKHKLEDFENDNTNKVTKKK